MTMGLIIYANESRGFVPIGYEGNKQFHYLIFNRWHPNSNTGGFMAYGLLYRNGILVGPDPFYCPTNRNPNPSSWNPWPPGESNLVTRSDYSSRPAVNWPSANFPAQMLKIERMDPGTTVIADNVSHYLVYLARHRGHGLNAARIDGSAGWVDGQVVHDYIFPQRTPFSGDNNPLQDQLWEALDKN